MMALKPETLLKQACGIETRVDSLHTIEMINLELCPGNTMFSGRDSEIRLIHNEELTG
ncbi:hypothetical protein [Mucilaginibacter ginsenosidivorans]|uniref:hypothetical protein n=1 Tax=Mucilaginibacter ginsenosidivorans TaxID=398053 RepID=UPI001651F13A|nr:hypothetical protein [Mucilaginibacter ginsenosidivorans]